MLPGDEEVEFDLRTANTFLEYRQVARIHSAAWLRYGSVPPGGTPGRCSPCEDRTPPLHRLRPRQP